jgi:nicotinate-nucleotide adenylyltransferase
MGLTGAAPPRRIGVFGGAFDPPHNAHLALAQAAVLQLRLDVLHVVPTGEAWHKPWPLTDSVHRLAMARLAFAGQPKLVVDDCEIRRAGPSYTIDTLRALHNAEPGAQLLLVMGEDQAESLDRWYEISAITQLAIISIARRTEFSRAGRRFDPKSLPNAVFQPLQLPLMQASATEVRARLAAGEGIDHLVPDAVARYIAQHLLYQTTR